MNGEGGPRQAAHTITIDTPSLDQDDLNLGYRLGYGAGYETGFAHGWNARDNELQAFFGLYRSLSERRRHAELEAIRSDTTPRRCRDECRQCSALCPPRASNPQLGQIPVAGFPRRWPVIAYGYVEDGAQVLAAVEAFLRRFVAYPSDHAAVAVTLWAAHTHVVDRFESSPRLACLSPEPGSGKTRNLEVLDLLVPRPMFTLNASAAALFRKVADPSGRPTVLIDEADTIFGPRAAREHEDLRGFVNGGHRRGAVASRCVVKGKTIEVEDYPVLRRGRAGRAR